MIIMGITMEHNTEHKIDGIYDNTLAIFENARTTLRVKAEIRDFVDADPTDIQIEILDYAAAIDMLDDLIVDDVIVDEEAYSIIYRLAEKYFIYVRDDYPGIGKLLQDYTSELRNHYSSRFED